MNVITKAVAVIEDVPDSQDTDPNGEFDVILSAQTEDRDGDTLLSSEWKQPLPDHITFDIDHGMSVASTVGSGRPFINENGDLQVRGTYSSIARAQEVRTLVREGHIRTTSVAFMTHKSEQKDAKPVRELLNGAFVAIPSNREAVVLSAKAMEVAEKAGARNSASDQSVIQDIHDAAAVLGADCGTGSADGANKSAPSVETKDTARESLTIAVKSIAGSVEELGERLQDALTDAYSTGDDTPGPWPWIRATFLNADGSGTVVYNLNGETLSRTFTADGTAVSLGDEATSVSLVTTVVPDQDGEPNENGAPAESSTGAPALAEKSAAAAATSDDEAAAVELRGRALQLIAESAALLG